MRVRVVGDGSPRGTRVENAETGELVEGVQGVTIRLGVTQKPSCVIEVKRPSFDLTLDAETIDSALVVNVATEDRESPITLRVPNASGRQVLVVSSE